MNVGDVIRTRNLKSYFRGPEARGYAEFRTDNERSPAKQKVFVLMLLGIEPLQCCGNEELDCSRQLNAMGYWGEDQIIAALGREKAEELVAKMVEIVKNKEKTEKKDG